MSVLAQSLNVLAGPAIERLTPSRFISIARELDAAMIVDWETRRARQLERLNALLVHACAKVPLYRERYGAEVARRGLESLEQLAELPPITKSDLTTGFPDRVTAEDSDRGGWQYVASSGTVDRVVTVTEFERRDVGRGAALHAWQRGCGYRPGKPVVQIAANICNVVCGADASNADESFRREFRTWFGKVLRRKPASLSDLRGAYERRVYYRTRMLDPLSLGATDVDPARLEQYWQRLHRESPYIVHALPEYLLLLAAYARAAGKPPLGVPYFLPMGGLASPAMRTRITEGLGGTFLDFYGTAELGVVAFESADEAGGGMHVVQEQFIVEVVGEDGPVGPGQPGKLVITDLCNRAMPFVRYEVGDVASWTPAPDRAADGSPRLRLHGRADEVIATADGGIATGSDIRDLFFGELGCFAFRVLPRTNNRYDIDFVPGSAGPTVQRVSEVFGARVGPDARIRARVVPSIAAEKSGKFRFIKRDHRATVQR